MDARNLLWFDDQPEIVWGVASALEARGHKVAFEGSPAAARERVGTEIYDCVLIDVCLCHQDGSTAWGGDLAEELKSAAPLSINSDAPFLFVTAFGDAVDNRAFESHEGYLGTLRKSGDLIANITATLSEVATRVYPDPRYLLEMMERLERERDVAIQERGVQEALSSLWLACLWSEARRKADTSSRLLAIAQRIKHERDRAVRERDAQVALLELWLAAIWPSVEGDTDEPGSLELP
jgi:CheY-like chemotaxis protein